jgi:hypothetical protein
MLPLSREHPQSPLQPSLTCRQWHILVYKQLHAANWWGKLAATISNRTTTNLSISFVGSKKAYASTSPIFLVYTGFGRETFLREAPIWFLTVLHNTPTGGFQRKCFLWLGTHQGYFDAARARWFSVLEEGAPMLSG